MPTEVIQPKDEKHWLAERAKDVTSTEVAALFGCSPYLSEFELWHRKKHHQVVEVQKNERMLWGSRLEASIAAGVAEDENLIVRPFKEYMRIPELRVGSSFDYRILAGATARKASKRTKFGRMLNAPAYDSEQDGILEIKNVDGLAFNSGWAWDGENLEAPLHIELQVQHQLLVSGLAFAKIRALVGGNQVKAIERKRDEEVMAEIRSKVAGFWKSIEEGKEPAPDFERDAAFIARLYGHAEPGKVAPGSERIDQLVPIYKEHGRLEEEHKTKKRAAMAEILSIAGDAEKILGKGYTISCGVVGPCRIEAYTREGYRNFKVFLKKEAKA